MIQFILLECFPIIVDVQIADLFKQKVVLFDFVHMIDYISELIE